MTTGIELTNRFGENIFDMNNPVYYLTGSGAVADIDDVIAEGTAAAVTDGFSAGNALQFLRNAPHTVSMYSGRTQLAVSGGEYTEVLATYFLPHPILNLELSDMVFYDVSTYGLLVSYNMSFNGFSDTTPIGGFGVCEIEGGNASDYFTVGTKMPDPAPAPAAGIQLFDDSGVVTLFDSRQPLFSIFDHFIIDQQLIGALLEFGDGHIDLKLSESNATFYVCAPNLVSFKSWTGGAYTRLMIKKLDNSTLRLSGEFFGSAGAATGTVRTLTNDIIILVGK